MLPLLALAGLVLLLRAHAPDGDLRQACLRAAVIWGALTVAFTELLSLPQALTAPALGSAWAVVAAACLIWTQRRHGVGATLRSIRLRLPDRPLHRLALAGLAIVFAITALVALIAPPQTYDSLTYHMSRVAHWAQNQSVAPYPTGIERQATMSPGAEFLVLQDYLLTRGDQLANMVGWAAFLGCALAAALIAGRLGGSATTQWVAAVLAATTPMAIVQASSTMTDIVLALWLVCAAAELSASWDRRPLGAGWAFIGMAAGLAILTKPVAFAYLLPMAIWALVILRRGTGRAAAGAIAVAVLAVAALNAGYFARNQALYGTPLGPKELIEGQRNQLHTPAALLSNLVRNMALHAGTPFDLANRAIEKAVVVMHDLIGADRGDPRTTLGGIFEAADFTTHEDLVGNPLQLALIVVAALVLLRAGRDSGRPGVYALIVIAGYLLFNFTTKWQAWGSRLQVPFFMLAPPFVALGLDRLAGRRGWTVLAAVLLLGALPWLLVIRSRPLIRWGDYTFSGSVLLEPRQVLYLNNTGVQVAFPEIAGRIQAAGCRSTGLMLGGDDPEYALWPLLGAPNSGHTLRWIVAGTPTAAYGPDSFEPCSIVCSTCENDAEQLRGLEFAYQERQFRLYLEP